MDAHYPFASRNDIWRVSDELKELRAVQLDQGGRLAQLEQFRDADARQRSLWNASPFPTSVGAFVPGGSPLPSTIGTAFNSPPDAFKGFDQAHHSAMPDDDEPRRGTSRANSVRFDESAIHGYGQASRTSNELPQRTGSSMSSHPPLERTFSHQSDGRVSSSGYSHQSARTNSLRLNTNRPSGPTPIQSPLNAPPGLFLLGPVPSIIRCWLTDNFTNDSLLYAAICSGSYVSTVGMSLIRRFQMQNSIMREDDVQYIKLPVYLPEAIVHPSSSRPETPAHQVPAVSVRFVVREIDTAENCIEIIIGSDVLRAQNADILFSQDKLIMVDSEHHRVSVPLVRPEKDTVFKTLYTSPYTTSPGDSLSSCANGHPSVGVIGRPTNPQQQSNPASLTIRTGENGDPCNPKPPTHQPQGPVSFENRSATSSAHTSEITHDDMPAWGSWRRDAGKTPSTALKTDKREMKVFRPGGKLGRANPNTTASTAVNAAIESGDKSLPTHPHTATPSGKGTNPIGDASAFGWLNPALNPIARGA